MANPQPEPFVQFSKELFDAILRSPMPGTHKEIVLAVVRRTYGDFGRKSAPISLTLLGSMLGRNIRHVRRCLGELQAEGVIEQVSPATFNEPRVLGLNKNYEKWGCYSVSTVGEPCTEGEMSTVGVGALSTEVKMSTPQWASTPSPQWACTPPIEDKRDIETREDPPLIVPPPPCELFDDFWQQWPNRHGNKELAGHRFKALSKKAQAEVMTAERHFVAAVDDGRYDPEFQPAAENFIGGRKHYYTQWIDGPPAKYAGQPRQSDPKASRGRSSGELRAAAASLFETGGNTR